MIFFNQQLVRIIPFDVLAAVKHLTSRNSRANNRVSKPIKNFNLTVRLANSLNCNQITRKNTFNPRQFKV